MKFSSFLCILLGVKLVGIGIGVTIGYYLYERSFGYHYLYLTIPVLTFGSLLLMFGALSGNKNN